MPQFTSTSHAPGTLVPPVPRFEIGSFFVTIYHSDKRTRAEDPAEASSAAKKLMACLGETRPMFINLYHPSSPATNTAGSEHPGSKEEVHDGEQGRLAHIHIELIGAQRDIPFSTSEIKVIKHKLAKFGWA